MSAQRAAVAVNEAVTNIIETAQYLTRQTPWAQDMFAIAVDAGLGNGMSFKVPRNPPPTDIRLVREVVFSAQDVATRRIWQRSRVVYDIDQELWDELGAIDEDTVLPARVFAHLPHPDPFIAWPDGQLLPLADGTQMRGLGCFVTGKSASKYTTHADLLTGPNSMLGWSVSTHSPHATGDLVITIVSAVHDANGRLIRLASDNLTDCIVSRVSLEVGGVGDVRVGDLIDAIAARYSDSSDRMTVESGATFDNTVRPMLRRIISTLLYLCATNADLRPVSATTTRHATRGAGAASKPPRVVVVGYAVGAGLRAWRRTQSLGAASGGMGRPMRPHIRRAHPHLFWTGEGRKIPRVRWLWPIRINADAGIKTTTVEPIRKRVKK